MSKKSIACHHSSLMKPVMSPLLKIGLLALWINAWLPTYLG